MELQKFESLYPKEARFAEVNTLLSYVRAGNPCQVIGMPGVGRSIFLGLLAYNRHIRTHHLKDQEKQFHFVLLDFDELVHKSFDEFVKFLLYGLVHSLHDRGLVEEHAQVKKIIEEAGSKPDQEQYFQLLKHAVDHLTGEHQLHLVFLLDAFESFAPTLSQQFFTQLSALHDRARYKLSFVFSLNRPMEFVVDQEVVLPSEHMIAGHTLYLGREDEVSTIFLQSYIEQVLQKKLTGSMPDEIRMLTGGHAKLLKVVVEEVLIHSVTDDTLSTFCLQNKAIAAIVFEIWNSLTPEEQALLKKYIQKQQIETSLTSWKYLQDVGLFGDLKITIPLFTTVIQQQIPEGKKEKILYKEETNDIYKGGTLLTSQLTSSEFKLLRFLLHNPDSVLGRDAVIAAVWGDAKSTAGVTDQAIDQLLFRLRRKIEDDPNNPSHLLVIKGRGISFTP